MNQKCYLWFPIEQSMAKKSANPSGSGIPLELGKLPPQAPELEEAVLGAVMLEKGAISSVAEVLRPDSFYKEQHKVIFEAMLALFARHDPIDMLTVAEELRRKKSLDEVGGAAYIAHLTSRVASAAHADFHSRIIQQKYIQRELIRVSSDMLHSAFDDGMDVDDLLNESEKALFEIAQTNIKKETQPINVLVKEAIDRIAEIAARDDGFSGVPSGYTELDRITSGWQRSDLVIIAARPSMGKTAFVLSMTRRMAVEHKQHVVIFSLEMASIQLVNRLIVGETEIASEKIRNGKLTTQEWTQLEDKVKTLSEASIFIDDTPGISIFELRAKCRRLKLQDKLDIVIIDYLQLMTGSGDSKGNREQEVSTISRSLKALAKELDVPVIALSQLNRGVEARTGIHKRPQLSDLRESGAIEQDADIVIFIHRPEKYGITQDEQGMSLEGVAEIIIAKHRNGALDDVRLRFRQELARFEEFERGAPIALPPSSGTSSQVVTYTSKMNADASAGGDFLMPNTDFGNDVPF